VALEKRDEQGTTELVSPTAFEVEPLNFATLPPPDREAVMAFARQTGELQRAALGTLEALNDGLSQVAKHQADHRPDADLAPQAAPGCAQPGVEAAGPARAVHRRSDQEPAQRASPGRLDRPDRDHHRRPLVDHVGPDRLAPQELRDRGCRVRGGPEEPPSSARPRPPRPTRNPRSRRRSLGSRQEAAAVEAVSRIHSGEWRVAREDGESGGRGDFLIRSQLATIQSHSPLRNPWLI